MTATLFGPHKSSIGGLDANIMALLCYVAAGVLGWIPYVGYVFWLAPLVIFFLEKQSGFVRFHALQAFILSAVYFIVVTLIGGIIYGAVWASTYSSWQNVFYNSGASLVGLTIVSIILFIISLPIWIFEIIALYNAYQYKQYMVPVVGKLAEKYSAPKAG